MADIPAAQCELSLLLFDPVPGDLLTVAQLDLLRLTNTAASGDMSKCACLTRALAIYPYEPLPSCACHAPILCRYPPHCACTRATSRVGRGMVEEEVTLGCHQGALFTHGLEAPSIDLSCALSFLRIRRWLIECGTPLDQRHVDCTVDVSQLESFCRQRCAVEARRSRPSRRASHSAMSMWGASILRNSPGHGAAGPERIERALG